MTVLTTEAAHALYLDQPADGQHILWKLYCLPGQYIVQYRDNTGNYFKGVSPQLLRQAFSSETIDSGWLPPNVYRWGRGPHGDWMVAFYPPARYTLQFDERARPSAFSLSIPLPGLVFGGVGSTYYVWAIKDRQFSPQAHLFAAPLPNLWRDGKICFGSNTPPEISVESWQAIEVAWKLFMTSPFIGDLATNKSQAHPQDVRQQLLALSQQKRKRYPPGDLVAYTNTSTHAPTTVAQAVTAYFVKPSSSSQ